MNFVLNKYLFKKRINKETHGLIISFLLTTVSFLMTYFLNFFLKKSYIFLLLIFSILQIVSNVVYFFNVNSLCKKSINILIIIFTLLVVLILFFGSIWIMKHLHHNLLN